MKKIISIFSIILFSTPLLSQGGSDDNLNVEKDWKKNWENLDVESLVKRSKSDPVLCKKHNGEYIGYYSKVYYVENCERRELSTRDIYEISKNNYKINIVDSNVVNGIIEGPKYTSRNSKFRGCKFFNGKYVTVYFTEIYFVEKCIKRLFPDWVTYRSHRQSRKISASEPLYEVTQKELQAIKTGGTFESDLDSGVVDGDGENLDILPVDEACVGINNSFVYYYSKVYYIEKCKKRLLDYRKYNDLVVKKNIKLKKMTSSQWMSIPDGSMYK